MTRPLSFVLFAFLSLSLHAQHYSPPPNYHYTPPTPKFGPGFSVSWWNVAFSNREISRRHTASGAYYLLWTDKTMKGEGPMVEFTELNLEEALMDNEKALVLLKKRKYKKAIGKYND